jgi:hypothetical protein
MAYNWVIYVYCFNNTGQKTVSLIVCYIRSYMFAKATLQYDLNYFYT